jgi:hypothetical protein
MNATTPSSNATVLKWGEAVTKFGFQIVPDALLKYQAVLGRDENGANTSVSSPELVVLLNVLMHWWTKETVPFPSAQAIAERIGIDRRSVDRAVEGLVRKEILKKIREGSIVMYDPSPLVERLQQLTQGAKAE